MTERLPSKCSLPAATQPVAPHPDSHFHFHFHLPSPAFTRPHHIGTPTTSNLATRRVVTWREAPSELEGAKLKDEMRWGRWVEQVGLIN